MSGLSFTFSYFLGIFLECVLYGIFLSLFIAACYIQWEKFSSGRAFNRLMAVTTAFFGLTTTVHLIVGLYTGIAGVLHTPPGAVVQLYVGPPYPAEGVASIVIFHFQTTVTDMIVVYRMYHIYDRNPWVCVIPAITIMAMFSIGFGLVHQLRNPVYNGPVIESWDTAAYCLTIFNSTFTTGAISLRLWLVHRETVKAGLHAGGSVVLRAMRVLVESAALWTAFASINFFFGVAKSNLAYTTYTMSSPVVGIAFCLIIVRLGKVLPIAQEETWRAPTHTPSSRMPGSGHISVSFPKAEIRRDMSAGDSKDFPMGAIESQKQEYVDSSEGVLRPSISLSAPR